MCPQVSSCDHDVCHLAARGIHANRADWPDLAIGGVHVIAVALFYLTWRDDVDGLLFRYAGDGSALGNRPARVAPPGWQQLNRDPVPGHELAQRLLGGLKVLEFRFGAAEADRA